jgi:hypothetical protein
MLTDINSLATVIVFFNKVTGSELHDGFSLFKQITSKFSHFLIYFPANRNLFRFEVSCLHFLSVLFLIYSNKQYIYIYIRLHITIFSPQRPDQLWGSPSLLSDGYRWFILGVKLAGA